MLRNTPNDQKFRKQLIEVIADHPGNPNMSKVTKRYIGLYQWIESQTKGIKDLTKFAQKIWCAANNIDPHCTTSGKLLSWTNLDGGFGKYCSKTKSCTCLNNDKAALVSAGISNQKVNSTVNPNPGKELEELQEIISNNYSRDFGKFFRNKAYLEKWVRDQTIKYNPRNLNECIWIIIKGLNGVTPPLCINGNKCKFNTYEKGYVKGCENHKSCGCISI